MQTHGYRSGWVGKAKVEVGDFLLYDAAHVAESPPSGSLSGWQDTMKRDLEIPSEPIKCKLNRVNE